MDFLIRKRVYLILLIILIILIPLFYVIFITLAPGLEIDANLDLKGNPKINVLIENNSSHVINNLVVYLNDKNVKVISLLNQGAKERLEYPALSERMLLKITADNHLPFEREFTLNKNNLGKDIVSFKPSYIFREASKFSDVNMKLCNATENEISLNVDLLTDGDLKSNNANQLLTFQKTECKLIEYHIIFYTTGDKKVTFKLYNDIYSKELLISGVVN